MNVEQKTLFIIFGGTGDLAQRKLYPSIFKLYKLGWLKNHFAVIGTARRPWSDSYYHQIVIESIKGLYDNYDEAKEFANHFYYQSHNVTDADHYVTLKKLSDELDEKYHIGGNRLFYLAMSPKFFGSICSYLEKQHIKTKFGYNRVVIEKPFGRDYPSAFELNKEITEAFPEEEIYRIDHYLGKEMVQNIIAIRFANSIFNAMWNNRYIDNIQITLSESLGVEERAGYYETSGALRDMVQNHILQMVALLTMNAPVSFSDSDIRTSKINALKALKVYLPEEIKENFVRGQYLGNSSGLLAYRNEEMVAKDSTIETYVAGKLEIKTMDLAGVPIYIRTGKRLAKKSTRIDVVFKQVPNNVFEDSNLRHDVLTINVDPNPGLRLQLNSKTIGQGFSFDTHKLNLKYKLTPKQQEAIPDAYEKLILDVLQGKKSNFTHWDELKYSWKFVDSIRKQWDKDSSDSLVEYESGTMGPKAAEELLEKNNDHWEF